MRKRRASEAGCGAAGRQLFRRCSAFLVVAGVVLTFASACDLLNQTPVIREGSYSAKQAPARLSAPDSVLKMLEYVFDRHTPETLREFADLLYTGYVYRYDDPTDQHDLELDRASEIQVYRNIFQSFETIRAEFYVEDGWTQYGSEIAPLGALPNRVSERHPDENWEVLRIIGDMEFTNTSDKAQIVGYGIRQRFELGFRLKKAAPDSVWELASWTDRESLLSARIARAK